MTLPSPGENFPQPDIGTVCPFSGKGRNPKEYLLLCAETVLAKQKVADIPSVDRINSIYSEAH